MKNHFENNNAMNAAKNKEENKEENEPNKKVKVFLKFINLKVFSKSNFFLCFSKEGL